MIEEKYVVFLAIQYAISFFIFGVIWQAWRNEDKEKSRERFWLVKHYWRKMRSSALYTQIVQK